MHARNLVALDGLLHQISRTRVSTTLCALVEIRDWYHKEIIADRVDQKGIKIVTIAKIVTTAKYLQGKVVRAIVRGILVSVVVGAFVVVGAPRSVAGPSSVPGSPSVVSLLHKLVLQQN